MTGLFSGEPDTPEPLLDTSSRALPAGSCQPFCGRKQNVASYEANQVLRVNANRPGLCISRPHATDSFIGQAPGSLFFVAVDGGRRLP